MTTILRSYQVYGANDEILSAAAEAIQDALKDAKSSSKVQRVALRRQGYRQDLEVGDVYVVPASVCDKAEDFPMVILYANLRKHATAEGMVEFQMGTLVEPGEISSESLKALKDVAFTNSKGEPAPLIVFAPSWSNPSDYQSFVYEGEDSLIPQIREVAYASPFNPSLSSAFDQLKAVDPDMSALAVNLPSTQHIFQVPASEDPDYPKFAKGLDIAIPAGSKKASLGCRPVVRLTAAPLPTAEKAVLGDDELGLFDAVDKQVGADLKSPAAVAASLCTAGALPDVYVDPDFARGESLRAHPDYGEAGTCADKTPDRVDGPSANAAAGIRAACVPSFHIANTKTKQVWAAADVDGIKFGGDWSSDITEAAAFISKAAAEDEIRRNFLSRGEAEVVEKPCACENCTCKKEASAAPGPWVVIDEATGKVHTTCKNKGEATKVYNKLNAPRLRGDDDAPSYEMWAKSHYDEMQPKAKEAKWKRASNWYNPGSVLEQFAPELAGSRVDSPFLNQQENESGYINPFGAPGKETSMDNTGMGLNQQISDGAGNTVPLRQENNFYGPDFARNFYAPHTDISPGALTVKRPRAASRKAAATGQMIPGERGYIQIKQRPNGDFQVAIGDGEWKSDALGVFPTVPEAVLAGMEAYVGQEGGYPQQCSFQLTESLEPSVADYDSVEIPGNDLPTAATGVIAANFSEGSVPTLQGATIVAEKLQAKLKAAGGKQASRKVAHGYIGFFNGKRVELQADSLYEAKQQAIAHFKPAKSKAHMVHVELAEKDGEQVTTTITSRKKADSNLSLFQGLSIADPEKDGDFPDEHPQASTDERAAEGPTAIYEDPGVEVSAGDPLFIQMDLFIKQILAAYASQLISAFQVTTHPISLGVPFEDTLDLADLIRYAGGPGVSDSARDAAVTQLTAGMNKLNDGQRRLLLENAFAQAAVWCNSTGGFNYEVFVRATELGESTMKVTVVTGQKGA